MCVLLIRYSAIRGDWDSLLIIDKFNINHVIPMRPTTLSECLNYFFGESTVILMDEYHNPILNVMDGLTIYCLGSWSCPSNFFQYRTAITTLHKFHDNGRQYVKYCNDCKDDYDSYFLTRTGENGCRNHHLRSQHTPEGDPTTSDIFESKVKTSKKKWKKHFVKSATHFLLMNCSGFLKTLSPQMTHTMV